MTGSHVGSIVRGKSPFTIDDVEPIVRAAIDPQLFMVKEGGRFETRWMLGVVSAKRLLR